MVTIVHWHERTRSSIGTGVDKGWRGAGCAGIIAAGRPGASVADVRRLPLAIGAQPLCLLVAEHHLSHRRPQGRSACCPRAASAATATAILDSLFIFGAIQSGAAITYLDWLGWFRYTLLFNMLGGLVLVTALRLLRTKELFEEKIREDGH